MSLLNASVSKNIPVTESIAVAHGHIKDAPCFAVLEACGFVLRLAASGEDPHPEWGRANTGVLLRLVFVLTAGTQHLLEALSLGPLAVSSLACVREDVSSAEPFLLKAQCS